MKINNKILALFISIVMLSGCTVTNTTTNTFDEKGRVKIIKKMKISKNTSVLKGLGVIATAVFMGKAENGVAIATALLGYDINNKTYKLQREIIGKENTKKPNEKI